VDLDDGLRLLLWLAWAGCLALIIAVLQSNGML